MVKLKITPKKWKMLSGHRGRLKHTYKQTKKHTKRPSSVIIDYFEPAPDTNSKSMEVFSWPIRHCYFLHTFCKDIKK